MKKRISVALATYNGEKYIEQQLLSLLQQSMPVDEIIICDDCSSDHTLDIIKPYTMQDDCNIKVFKSDTTLGYVKNFAKALKMTSGDLIFLCDQDDIWEKEKVERVVKVFDAYQDILCVNTSFTYMDKDGKNIAINDDSTNYGMCWSTTKEFGIQSISFDEIRYHNISMGCTMALRSEIKDIYLKQSKFIAAHDWELNFIASLKQGLVFYNRPLMKYRIHDHNTTGNDKVGKKNHVGAQEREKNAHSLLEFAMSTLSYQNYFDAKQSECIEHLISFHEKRINLLKNGKKFEWIYLVMKYSIYKRIVSKKGMLVDLLYKNKD